MILNKLNKFLRHCKLTPNKFETFLLNKFANIKNVSVKIKSVLDEFDGYHLIFSSRELSKIKKKALKKTIANMNIFCFGCFSLYICVEIRIDLS